MKKFAIAIYNCFASDNIVEIIEGETEFEAVKNWAFKCFKRNEQTKEYQEALDEDFKHIETVEHIINYFNECDCYVAYPVEIINESVGVKTND